MNKKERNLKAFMLGPKAENLDLFRQLIGETLDDHAYWRRNFHPEDLPAIRRSDQTKPGFRDQEDHLRDLLFEFLSESKQGIPFSSPRYVGHMNTDLMLPAMLGYFAAMLYNQNNVALESSPVTARLESEVIRLLAEMIGYVGEEAGTEKPTGYLSSGGTAANIYALWVARNLRAWPLALRLAVEAEPRGDRRVTAIADCRIGQVAGRSVTLTSATAWELLNLPLASLYSLRTSLVGAVREAGGGPEGDDDAPRAAARFVDKLARDLTIGHLGAQQFFAKVSRSIPGSEPTVAKPWKVLLPANKHYSFEKAVDLLGLGRSALETVPFIADFTTDLAALRSQLEGHLRNQAPVLAIATIFGSTEEGSLDDVPAIADLRDTFEARGLAAWLHADACYGGYLGAMIRAGGVKTSPVGMTSWLRRLAGDYGLEETELDPLIDVDSEPGWLSWPHFIDRVSALARANSVALDPHKLGYVPYPAGAILMKSAAGQDTISYDAPYLGTGGEETQDPFVGRFTLEGSRPGAVAAACWLAHRAVPLSQEGHGKILGGSMLAARQLFRTLETAGNADEKHKIAFVSRPHFNILCYVPFHRDVCTIDEMNGVTRRVADRLDPGKHPDFMAVRTTVAVPWSDWLRGQFSKAEGLIWPGREAARPDGLVEIDVLRSVIMGPLALFARTRRSEGKTPLVFDEYAAELLRLIGECHSGYRLEALQRSFHPTEKVLVVDNDPAVFPPIEEVLRAILGRPLMDRYEDLDLALEVVEDQDRPLRFAILDVDLGQGARKTGGWTLLKAMCQRNESAKEGFRVERVIMLTVGDASFDRQVQEIETDFRRAPVIKHIAKGDIPTQADGGFLNNVRSKLLGVD